MFDLKSVIPANKEWKPQKILVYGVQGLGKTTFGATFEKPILARTEDGAGAIDCPTFPNKAWEEFKQQKIDREGCDELAKNTGTPESSKIEF